MDGGCSRGKCPTPRKREGNCPGGEMSVSCGVGSLIVIDAGSANDKSYLKHRFIGGEGCVSEAGVLDLANITVL